MTALVWLATAAYAATLLRVAVWMRRSAIAGPEEPLAWPNAAVLVAARNEEHTLPRCLEALRRQRYPAERLDVLVADDHSTDGTAEVVRRFQREGFERLRLVPVPPPSGSLRGKANALHAALKATDAPLLLVTDADCAPPPTWAAHLAAAFADPDVGLACGRTAVRADGSLAASVQTLDWAFLLAVAAFLAGRGRPITGMGNNMAFRRTAYDAVGGYPALPFSVTEDYLLVRAVHERTRFRVAFPPAEALVVETLPVPTLRDAFRQRLRWARGGLRAPLWVYPVYAGTIALHAALVGLLFLSPLHGIAALALKGAGEALVARAAGAPMRARALAAWQAFVFGYVLGLPFVLAARLRVNWKGRQY